MAPTTITITDALAGKIELRTEVLEARFGDHGRWEGQGSEWLNAAVDQGWFAWPRRIHNLRVQGATVRIGMPTAQMVPPQFDSPTAFRNAMWPIAQHETMIGCVVPFTILARVRARLYGTVLLEQA